MLTKSNGERYRTTEKRRVREKSYRDRRRALGLCINSESHGNAYVGGRCFLCWLVKEGKDVTEAEKIAGRIKHLTPLEWRFARDLGVGPPDIDGPPRALIVGEAPGKNGHGRGSLAMFPYPPTSAAGRLLRFSGMPAGVFLGRFLRRNLMEELPERWSNDAAIERAIVVRDEARAAGLYRIVVLGRRVADAFEFEDFFVRREFYGGPGSIEAVAIPHPSGMNPAYNVEETREAARRELMWAAGLS